jgi:hypothetical protein
MLMLLLLFLWSRKMYLEPDEGYSVREPEQVSMALQVGKEQSGEGCDYWPCWLIVMRKERVDLSAPTLSATIQSSLQRYVFVHVPVHGLNVWDKNPASAYLY